MMAQLFSPAYAEILGGAETTDLATLLHRLSLAMAVTSDFLNSKVVASIESLPLYYKIPATLLLLLLTFIIKRRYFSPLRRFPGPFWASVTRWWLVHQIFRGDHEKVMLRLHAKYGPIIRISPFEVAISDPEAIKIIYGHTSNFTKVRFQILPPFFHLRLFEALSEY